MKKITYYEICYTTLSGRVIETGVAFTTLPEANRHIEALTRTRWDTKFFTKQKNFQVYERAEELNTEEELEK